MTRVFNFSAGPAALPESLDAGPGSFVTVPLGPREMTGVIWAERGAPDAAQAISAAAAAGVRVERRWRLLAASLFAAAGSNG